MKTHLESSLLNIRRILIPCDFSPPSERALVYALRFAEEFNAELTLLHVADPITYAPAHCSVSDFMNWVESRKQNLKDKLRDLVGRLSSGPEPTGLPNVEYVVVEGEAGDVIVTTAAERQIDLLIIATHGYSGIKRFMVGSTAHRVVTHAGCPVLVVREVEHEFVALPKAGATAATGLVPV